MLGNFFHVYPDKLLRGEIEAKRTYGEILKLAEELFEKVSRINEDLKRVLLEKDIGIKNRQRM